MLFILVAFFIFSGAPPSQANTPTSTPPAISTPSPPITLGSGCTLADAITAANTDTATGSCSAGSGADTIVFTANVTLSAHSPAITSDITFSGNNYTLDGADSYRLFNISDVALTVAINNLTLNNSTGAIVAYGGSLTISNGSFNSNSAYDGAAIYTEGSVIINDSSFSNNFANRAGGAIYTLGGSVTVSGSSFSGNSVMDYGGAITASSGSVTISDSSFRNNSSSDGGGGALYTSGTLTISNSTFSNNSTLDWGGAIYQWDADSVMTLSHVTIADNSALQGNGIYNNGGSVNMRNSLLKDNGDSDACYTVGALNQNVGNLISDGSCSPAFSGDPKLGAYSNGYYPLQSGSPAVNAADATYCLSADQIGTTRPQGSACDIGAFELFIATATPTATDTPTATNTPTSTITPTAGGPIILSSSCTLPDAIIAANTDTATGSCPAGNGDDTIVFTANVTLSANTPRITSNITFSGNDYTLDGADSYRLFVISAAPVTINNLTLKNGSAATRISGNQDGGAIYIAGSSAVTINNSTFSHNSADDLFGRGGAIMVEAGSVTINNISFSNNSAIVGNAGAIGAAGGSVAISNSSFSNNSAYGGGAIDAWGSSAMTVSNSTLDNNSAYGGGAISTDGGTLTISNSRLNNNSATSTGGVINIWGNSIVTISKSTLNNNSATSTGGAIYTGMSCGTLTLTHVTIADNTAPQSNGVYLHGGTTNIRNKLD